MKQTDDLGQGEIEHQVIIIFALKEILKLEN